MSIRTQSLARNNCTVVNSGGDVVLTLLYPDTGEAAVTDRSIFSISNLAPVIMNFSVEISTTHIIEEDQIFSSLCSENDFYFNFSKRLRGRYCCSLYSECPALGGDMRENE